MVIVATGKPETCRATAPAEGLPPMPTVYRTGQTGNLERLDGLAGPPRSSRANPMPSVHTGAGHHDLPGRANAERTGQAGTIGKATGKAWRSGLTLMGRANAERSHWRGPTRSTRASPMPSAPRARLDDLAQAFPHPPRPTTGERSPALGGLAGR